MRKIYVILISTLFCSSLLGQTKKVLFLGNSYTGVNNLPVLVNSVANSVGDTVIYDSNTPGGSYLSDHASNPTSIGKIFSNDWDYVVLQDQSQEPSWPDWQLQQQLFPYAEILCDTIRNNNPCTMPLFFMTWGRENGDSFNCSNWPPVCTYEGMDSILNQNYQLMGTMNKAYVSPVGAVWNYIRSNYPAIDLYSADESHPAQPGSYAAACTFYTMIFQKDPTLITYNYTLSAADADSIKQAVKEVVYNDFSTWNVGEYGTIAYSQVTSCDSAAINGNWYNQSQLVKDTLVGQAQFGCDSIISTDLTIIQVDESVTTNDSVITSNEIGADSYQWLDCDNGNSIINGETTQSFSPTVSGNYAVEITLDGCIKTSICTSIIITSIETSNRFHLTAFPNPLSNKVKVNLGQNYSRVKIELLNSFGKLIYLENRLNIDQFELSLGSFSSGIYIIKIIADSEEALIKVIKE